MMAELEDKEVPELEDNSVPPKPVGKAMSSQRGLQARPLTAPGRTESGGHVVDDTNPALP